MAHTNQTAHYHLPQFVGTDILNPLTDLNGAFEDIDTALYEQGQGVADVVDDIDALKIQNGNSALDTTAQTLSGAINELKSGEDALGLRVTANETDISTLQTQMSTATGNITTLNTSVAGLQTEMAGKASATALNNLTTKVGTGNLNTTAQNCVDAINEVLAELPSGGGTSADDVTYDNTDSGLTATNVQDAIDEVKADIPVVPTRYDADAIVYDNQTSGLTATDVQSAIDELAQGGNEEIVFAEHKIGTYNGKDVFERRYFANNLSATATISIDTNFKLSDIETLLELDCSILTNVWREPFQLASNSALIYIDTTGVTLSISNETVAGYSVKIVYTKP